MRSFDHLGRPMEHRRRIRVPIRYVDRDAVRVCSLAGRGWVVRSDRLLRKLRFHFGSSEFARACHEKFHWRSWKRCGEIWSERRNIDQFFGTLDRPAATELVRVRRRIGSRNARTEVADTQEERRMFGRITALVLCVALLLAGAVPALATTRAVDDVFWESVKSCTDGDEVRMYLGKFPRGRHVAEARACLRKLAVRRLLVLCASHVAANRLVGAAGRSAADCYRKVLALDRTNRVARAGLQKIIETIEQRARAALRRGDIAEAREQLSILERLIPGSPTVAAIESAIAAAVRRRRTIVMPPGQHFRDCGVCPQMVALPVESFTMGSPSSEVGRKDSEGPPRIVSFRKQIAVGKYEVTFAEWDACESAGGCENWPGDVWGRGNRPVIKVSWRDAEAYVRWLSAATGKGYRLLSEAEWEYAARAGSRTAYGWGAFVGRNRANCKGCGSRWRGKKTAPVGSFPANRFGLHDMHGNVREWVEDCSHENYRGAPQDGSAWTDSGNCRKRMKRGGSWKERPEGIRAASRMATKYKNGDRKTGFRVALTLSR